VSPIDDDALATSLKGLEIRHEPEPYAALQHVIDAAHHLFGLTGAGLMLVDESGDLRYVTASDEAGRELEHAQLELGLGPCIECVLKDRIVPSEDLLHDPAWPLLGERVAPQVRAMLGVPVRLYGAPVGSLNVYRNEPSTWDDSDRRAMVAYGEVVERILAAAVHADKQSRLAAQLQGALDSRVAVERAVGFLMARLDVDETIAFETLRRRARKARRKIVDVANELLTTAPGTRRGRMPTPAG
jgi:GAF domain-containing protein